MPTPGLRDPFPFDPTQPTDPNNRPGVLRTDAPEPIAIGVTPLETEAPIAIGIVPDAQSLGATRARTPARELAGHLQQRLGDLKERAKRFNDHAKQRVGEHFEERVRKPASAASRRLKKELAQDADYVKVRVRYYHEHRPLHALGMVAAAGFFIGLIIGLRRR